ncbi:hypothetical protein LINPERPRIM_LOCUS22335 [Linum perenne]
MWYKTTFSHYSFSHQGTLRINFSFTLNPFWTDYISIRSSLVGEYEYVITLQKGVT